MNTNAISNFETFLNAFDERQWLEAVGQVVPQIHEVDRNAVQIWFRFYPLELFRYLQTVEDKAKAIHQFAMQGDFELKNQIDTSHRFLYGHRFWSHAKTEIENYAAAFNGERATLKTVIETIAQKTAEKAQTDQALTLAITAAGLMTLNQVGFEQFKNAAGASEKPSGVMTKSPNEIVAQRARDDGQGFFGFLKTVDKKFTADWINSKTLGSFPIKNDADIATASALDQRQNWRAQDERCWEGVVPVECRSAACGTCWVGVLGGAEKLSDVQRLERKQMKIFGYNQPDEAKPFMRLACQAKTSGNVSIVIPPWNGVFGKKVYGNVETVELEPVTTSAAKLRETIATATKED